MLHFREYSLVRLRLAVVLTALRVRRNRPRCSRDGAKPTRRLRRRCKQISAQRIQANIEKLVSFGTRLTLSAQDPASIAAGMGIGAAREWIKSEFERYSKDCGGCLEVKTDSFTEEPAERIPKATEITNVYAVLKGTDRGECQAHRAGNGALRFAQQRHLRREGRRTGSER